MADAPSFEPGHIVAERYEVIRVLGVGGMGAVYLARHLQLHREVALKVLLPALASSPDVVQRFIREARSAASIGHPGIVEVFDLGHDVDGVFLAMERLEGVELQERIEEGHPLPIGFVARVVGDLAEAIDAAHAKGIVHRDLKPQNVFLATRGRTRDVVKVLDFGIAKLLERQIDDALTQTGQVFGTPLYMPPEQLRAVKDLDARADVYAMGAILYQALTGRVPFAASNYAELVLKIASEPPPPVEQLRPDVPAGLAQVVRDAMHVDRDHRTASARALHEALLPFVTDSVPEPSAAVTGSQPSLDPFAETAASGEVAPQATAPPESRRRFPAPLVAGVVLVLGVIGGAVAWGVSAAAVEPARTAPETETVRDEPAATRPLVDASRTPLPGDVAATDEGPERRRVGLATTPSGARVLLDGRVLCTTPCEYNFSGSVELELRRSGYQTEIRRLSTPLPAELVVDLRRRPRPMQEEPPPLRMR